MKIHYHIDYGEIFFYLPIGMSGIRPTRRLGAASNQK
jgi:hypothetical protein